MTALDIPDAALDALRRLVGVDPLTEDDADRDSVRDIAAPVVAAELHRIAGLLTPPPWWEASTAEAATADTHAAVAAMLRARADEITPTDPTGARA